MQILKDKDAGVLFSPFAIGGVWHLQVAVLHGFALDDPQTGLPEEDIWQQCVPLLGEGGTLDPGFPKPRGELLVCGSWYAPDAIPAENGLVRISCGPLHRSFAISGPRLRQSALDPVPRPAPQTCVPLTWSMTWGGPADAENRSGISRASAQQPQVENLTYGPVDTGTRRFEAACPLPVPADAPARLALAGTYGTHWQLEEWPGFPADINPEFFMLAQRVQRLDPGYGADLAPEQAGFFQGGEFFCLEGLHPTRPVISGHLPRKRVHVFATRTETPPQVGAPVSSGGTTVLEACRARLETIWFFPAVERGVALYRAVFPCRDDEYSDLVRLFAVVEEASAPEHDVAFWLEEQRRRTARPMPPSPSLPPETAQLLHSAQAATRTLEEDLHLALERAGGLAPVLPVSPGTLTTRTQQRVTQALARIDAARDSAGVLRQRFGHQIRIQTGALDSLRDAVAGLLPDITRAEHAMQRLEQRLTAPDKLAARALDARDRFTDTFPLTDEDRSLLDAVTTRCAPDKTADEDDAPVWSRAALRLLADHCLMLDESAAAGRCRALLAATGIPGSLQKRALLGFLPDPFPVQPADWGLDPATLPREALDETGCLVLPAGLLVPWFEGPECRALHVRPMAVTGLALLDANRDWIMPGSGQGVQVLGAIRPKPVLLSCDPLAAWLCYSEAGDHFAILLATDPAAPLPDTARAAVSRAACLFWPVPPLDDAVHPDGLPHAGGAWTQEQCAARAAALAARWSPVLAVSEDVALTPVAWPAAQVTAHLAAARHAGLDVRAWLLSLDSATQRGEAATSAASATQLPLPRLDISGMQTRLRAHAAHIMASVRAPLEPIESQGLARANERLQAAGLSPVTLASPNLDDLLAETLPLTPDPQILERFDRLETGMEEVAGQQGKDGVRQARQRYLKGLEQLRRADTRGRQSLRQVRQAARDGLKLPFTAPDWVRDVPGGEALLAQHATAPDPAALRQGGRSLTLRHMDLSGKDLTGMHLENSILEDVNLSGCCLRGVHWQQVMCTRVTLDGCDLSNAHLNLCSFRDCSARDLRAPDLSARLCQWQGGRLTGADMTGADMELCTFDGSELGGIWDRVHASLVTVRGGMLGMLKLQCCHLEKTTFISVLITSLLASGGTWRESGFTACSGGPVTMTDVDAENMRFLSGCHLTNVTLDRCRMNRLSMRDSLLPGLTARHCLLDDAAIDRCTLTSACLAGCRAARARLMHCDLERADLRRLRLPEGSLRRSRLVSANMQQADCRAADLLHVVLGETRLDGANLTGTLIRGRETILKHNRMQR